MQDVNDFVEKCISLSKRAFIHYADIIKEQERRIGYYFAFVEMCYRDAAATTACIAHILMMVVRFVLFFYVSFIFRMRRVPYPLACILCRVTITLNAS